MIPLAILAGGLATRLRPITEVIPKSLIEIEGKPFVHWQLLQLAKAGFTSIVLCVSYKSDLIESYLGSGARYGLKIQYSHDGPSQVGTGGAIIKALPLLGDKFMVLYGDSYLPINYQLVERKFFACEEPALMTVYMNKGKYDSSNVTFSNGKLISYKKETKSPDYTYIDYGLSCFDHLIFEKYLRDEPLDLGQIFTDLSAQKMLAGYEATERFYEIGSHQGIREFSAYVEGNLNELQPKTS